MSNEPVKSVCGPLPLTCGLVSAEKWDLCGLWSPAGLGVCPSQTLCHLPAALSKQFKLSFFICEMVEKKLFCRAVVRPKHQSTWGYAGQYMAHIWPSGHCGPLHHASSLIMLSLIQNPPFPASSCRNLSPPSACHYTSPMMLAQVVFLFLRPAVPLFLLPKPNACSKDTFGTPGP